MAVEHKHGVWIFKDSEIKLRNFLLPLVPKWLQTQHLTLFTLLWTIPTLFSGYVAQHNIRILLVCSVTVFGQYITDLLDGAVGRERKTGLVTWGFYMDHFLDFCFICSLLFAHYFIIPKQYIGMFILLIFLIAAHFIHTYLRLNITKQFEIASAYVGPTELRVLYVLVNILIVVFYSQIKYLLLFSIVFETALLIHSVYTTQNMLWQMDMKKKALKKK